MQLELGWQILFVNNHGWLSACPAYKAYCLHDTYEPETGTVDGRPVNHLQVIRNEDVCLFCYYDSNDDTGDGKDDDCIHLKKHS